MSLELEQRSFLTRKLTVAIATPITLLLVLGVVLGAQLLQMSDDAAWVDHTDEVIGTAHATMVQVLDQETAVRGFLVTDDRQFLEPYERVDPRRGFERLHELVADNPPQQARFDEAHRRYEVWIDAISSILEGRELAKARGIDSMRERKSMMDGVRDLMRAAVEVEQNLRRARVATSQASVEATKVFFVGLLLAIAALLALLSRRQLAGIASTFGAALAAEKAAREETAREAWVRDGHVKISAAMQGEKTTEQLGQDCLSTLVEYTGAEVAAFFLKDGTRWRLRAGIALDSRAADVANFGERDGMVGRAAASGDVLDLRDLPPGYLKVRSATGEALASHVLLVPARAEGTTYAVLELGFLRAADDRVVTLLRRVRETVALAVQSATYKDRLRALLEETQRQAEELQAQQEELQVQNEELAHHTTVLQETQTRLSNQQSELEQNNAQLEEQTATLERQRDYLTRAQGELQRVSEYKSEFLANVSHELRTPLNSSLILSKLLADNRGGNLSAEQVKFAQTIYSAGNDLLILINDILDLSKMQAGKLEMRPEPVALDKLFDDLKNTFDPVARDKQLELAIDVSPDLPASIYSDPTRLSQVLKNLLSNALKFTERGGVTLSARPVAGDRIAFDVKDTGIGIPPDQHELIFEAFRQADGTPNRKHGGTGLGLTISRDLARLLGGQLAITSAPERGSTFTLTLPRELISREVPLEPRAPRHLTLPGSHTPSGTPAVPPAAPSQPMFPDDRTSIQPGARSLLIIEDDPSFALILYELAHELDFRALVSSTAADGLALAQRYRPSAIVLDVGLPDRSGLSVLDALKHDPGTRHIPVHMMSVEDHAQTALQMGAAGYAIKPVQREELVDALERLESKFTRGLRRVLIVEDDENHRDSTCRLLAVNDVETVAVGTIAAALQQLRSSTFDCMVLDLTLPDGSGFDLLQQMSLEQQYGFPPVIVYTGRSLSQPEEDRLRQYSRAIIIKGARSPERLLDEAMLFLHQVEAELPMEAQRMLQTARHRDAVFEGRRVLVVEDDVRNIFALSSLLEPKGAKIEVARNGKEAIAHLQNKPGVDLVLMDIMMPEMDGLQAMREIRKRPELAKLPIIALTAKAMADDRDNCLAAGANDYISKPLNVDKLLSLVRVWMPK